ncbi:Mitochondrial inner membrane protease subunit 2 [Collichthys lucidus]|uniref:Mitochondrial inner membrane protease subunit 2 n=1 Tax=Collichthys lucidus TaxID=240159 RepID=A0A4U5UGK3_COLLU|nr:Mitochondrial inner membrane protease subunit 2 [Collichthys lucidus]
MAQQASAGRRYLRAFVSGFFVAVPVTVTVLDRFAYVARVEGASMQDELDEAIHVWDSHVIRPSKNDRVPSGQPRIMYMFPELYTSDYHIFPVDRADVQLCQSNCTFRPAVPCDTDIYNICNILMAASSG